MVVHKDCRRKYVDPKRVGKRPVSAPDVRLSTQKKQQLHSSQPAFMWKLNCFFCNTEVRFDEKHLHRCEDSRRVNKKKESVEMIKNIRERCDERRDQWGSTVKTRLSVSNDLVADEAVYHSSCYVSFFHNDSIKNETPGRPAAMQDIFERMCLWLQDESDLYTLEELQMKMLEYSGNNDV